MTAIGTPEDAAWHVAGVELLAIEEPPRLPDFPVEALPTVARRWVEAVACATQTPPALAGGMCLAAASTAVLGRAKVKCRSWEEELALYVVVILPSGERKSSVVKLAVAPLRAMEHELVIDAKASMTKAKAKKEMLEARHAQLLRDAARGKGDEDDLVEVAADLDEVEEVVEPRLLADDATPEALAGLLARHGQLGIVAAESAIFDNLAGRYADGKANLHLACQAYSGEETRIDRRDREEHLPRPLLALGLAVQPHVLKDLAANETMREQGFLARAAFLLPESRLGHRELAPPSVPDSVRGAYSAAIRTLATGSSVGSVASPRTLTFTPTAAATLLAHDAAHEPRLDPVHGDLAPIGSWANRHPGRVARIAGLLHLLNGSTGAIADGTLRAAIDIGDCLIAHAHEALISSRAQRRRLTRAAAWVRDLPDGRFSLRELHRGALNAHGTAEDAQEVVDELEQRGYIRSVPIDTNGRPGRPPSPRYEVNPRAREAP